MYLRLKKYFILFIILSLYGFCIQAQKKDSIASIKVISKPYKDSIVLRWAPSTPISWIYSNKYGYLIEKYILLKDSVIVQNPIRITITDNALKPLPLKKWEKQAETNKYAGIAAQAIYGESFELTENYSSDIVQVINKARELETRYSFALFSADMSPWVAKASALQYTDKNVKKGESYLYRIYSAVPEIIEKIDTGFVYVGIDDYKPLPKPLDLNASFSDKSVLLSWNKFYYESIYNTYIVERSDDGKSFYPIDELPIVNTESKTKHPTELMFKLDSLPSNNKIYYYRIKGIDAFGDMGPPSDTIKGMGVMELSSFPVIQNSEILNENKVLIKWKFPEKFNSELKGFIVERTGNSQYPFELISADTLAPDTRIFQDSTPLVSNYYKIKAIGKYNQQAESYPYLVQLPDSIPPLPPKELIGEIDSTGVVTLNWEKNKEPDLLGYRIYRSNFKDEDFIQITNEAVTFNTYIDSITLKTLTKTIYYKILAVDLRENPSDFSETLEIKRPDIIPPVQPIFKKITSEDEGIKLEWENSTSIDVVNHLLYRKKINDTDWKLVQLFNIKDSIQNYLDNQIQKGQKYEYTMVAVDNSRLESKPAIPASIVFIDKGIKPPVENFSGKADRLNKEIMLKWKYDYENVARFIIYKAIAEEKLKTYKALPGTENKFIDKALKINTNYIFYIKAEFTDGSQSSFSKKIIVNY